MSQSQNTATQIDIDSLEDANMVDANMEDRQPELSPPGSSEEDNRDDDRITVSIEEDTPEARMEFVRDILHIHKDLLKVMASWRLPEENKYTRKMLEGKEKLEEEITTQLSYMEHLAAGNQDITEAELSKDMTKAAKMRSRFEELKVLFQHYRENIEEEEKEKKNEKKEEKGSSSKRKATEDS